MKYPSYTIISIAILATLAFISFLYGATSTLTKSTSSATKSPSPTNTPPTQKPAPILTLHSNSFKNNTAIPSLYTCDGDNISPELSWTITDAQSIQSYVLIVDDPDAQRVIGKTFVHWIVLIASPITNLPAGISGKKSSTQEFDITGPTTKNMIEITNDSKKIAYYGPCPPADSGMHTYRFTLFAMAQNSKAIQTVLPNSPINSEQFKKIMQKSIVTEALLVGTYHKKTE